MVGNTCQHGVTLSAKQVPHGVLREEFLKRADMLAGGALVLVFHVLYDLGLFRFFGRSTHGAFVVLEHLGYHLGFMVDGWLGIHALLQSS